MKTLTKIYLTVAASAIPPLIITSTHIFSDIFNAAIGGLLFIFFYLTLTPLTKTINHSEIKSLKDAMQKTRTLSFIISPLLKYQEKLLGLFKSF